ncbi:MAG: hypothetical protein M0R06_00790 [Sphaerochaeta sp.]|jgi:replication factor A1|nr:hypothetical protein [Sphaerochaeta sp.]
MDISEIKKEPGIWLTVSATVVQLWESKSDVIDQIGLLGDESGVVKFVSFKKNDFPHLEVGKSYLLCDVVTDVYDDPVRGKMLSIKLNKNTDVAEWLT